MIKQCMCQNGMFLDNFLVTILQKKQGGKPPCFKNALLLLPAAAKSDQTTY